MGEGSQFVDIILFAMIAVFLVFRLRSVLGRRDEDQKPGSGGISSDDKVVEKPIITRDSDTVRERQIRDNVVEFPDRGRLKPPKVPPLSALESGLSQIRQVESDFSVEKFVSGAKTAFEIIVMAFAAGDKKALQHFLNNDVYNNFAAAIDARAQAGQVADTQLIGVPSAVVEEARITGTVATVTVRFTSEQVNVTLDETGAVIIGDPNSITKVIDLWTFSRDLHVRDPNWTLIATRAVE